MNLEELRKSISNVLYLITSISTIYGIYYLGLYLYSENIDFSSEYTKLPGMAMGIFILCFIYCVFFLSLIMIVVFIKLFVDSERYSDYFYFNYFDFKAVGVRANKNSKELYGVINYCVYFILPIMIAYFSHAIFDNYWVLVAVMIVVSVCLGYYFKHSKRCIVSAEENGTNSSKFIQLLSDVLAVISFPVYGCFAFSIYLEFVGIYTNNVFEIIIWGGLFFILNYFLVMPNKKRSLFEKELLVAKKSSGYASHIKYSIIEKPYLISVVFLFVILTWPSLCYPFVQNAFDILKFRSYNTSFYYNPNAKIAIPPEIIKCCDSNYCKTKELDVILKLGQTIYIKDTVTTDKGIDTVVTLLPGKDLYGSYVIERAGYTETPKKDDETTKDTPNKKQHTKGIPKCTIDSNIKPQQ